MTKSVTLTIDRSASTHEAYTDGAHSASRSFSIPRRDALYSYIARQEEATISVQLTGRLQAKVLREIEAVGVSVEVLRVADSGVEIRTRKVA